MTLYVVCGIPASGKTTLAKTLAEQHNANVHSIDDISGSWGTPDIDGRFRRQWMENIKANLRNGKSVVCDSLALDSLSRKWILDQVSGFECKRILVVKVVPLEICLQRNARREARLPDFVLEQAARRLEPPTPDEGWDEIYISRE